MTFEEILDQAIAMLQRWGRLTYSTLKRQFQLDDAALDDLKNELIEGQRLAADERGNVLVWTGGADLPPLPPPPAPADVHPTQSLSPPVTPQSGDAERRQLTVMFCDLVDFTRLSGHLDPEDLREVVRAYQRACAEVMQRFGGHIAQYLGDGLLVYFGYPQAHEDDAQRAVRAALGGIEALGVLNTSLERDKGIRLAVRLGMHTGLVVVGAMGGAGRQEQLALGEVPNIAARLQGLAEPDTVLISADTYRLIQGYFACRTLGDHALRGVAQPIAVYQVLQESGAQSRLDIAGPSGLTLLVGRESEVLLLLERWAHSQDGAGQVVLLRGEAGIGKSRLVEVLRERVISAGTTRIVFHCSPYYQHSALYPVIDHLQRFLRWQRDEAPEAKFDTLERVLRTYRFSLEDVVPLFAALLSVPLPERYPSLNLSPQRQRQKTQEALVAWLLEEAERQPVLAVWEDLHWADPSTLELLGLVLDQVPTARMLTLLTCRPEFHPPWATHSHITQVTLTRLERPQVEAMITSLSGAKALPAAMVEQVVAKTDGVPLFVEELVKMLLESGLVRQEGDRYVLSGPLPPLAIPSTLHDSLMARLDRLATVKAVAQLGATIGRTFAYELLQAVSPLDEAMLQQGLRQVVEAELVSQQGMPPHATYTFKHALIQEAAYQSLLRSTRQQYHQRIAQVLEARFPASVVTQPELVAQHYTAAGCHEQAVYYWQRAGRRAIERSAHVEAIAHLTKGLELLRTLPDTPERAQQELTLQIALGVPLMVTKGHAAPEAEQAYGRARELCRQVGETPQLFRVLVGLWRFYLVRGDLQTARELAEQLLTLAQRVHDPLGITLFCLGDLGAARGHLEQAIAVYDSQKDRSHASHAVQDPEVACLSYLAWALWLLGYPDQALKRSHEALTLAQELSHPFSQAFALHFAAILHQLCLEGQVTQERAEAVMALSHEQGFPFFLSVGTVLRGWALAQQGQGVEGIAQMHQGLAAHRATGAELNRPHHLAMLADAYAKGGQAEEGLHLLSEALALADKNGERVYEAELHRLKGELLLALPGEPQTAAETCFAQALAIARQQQANSWELRAAMSLSRLWQRQGKRDAARQVLAEVYGWFTEGFDTADLQEAKALLETLA